MRKYNKEESSVTIYRYMGELYDHSAVLIKTGSKEHYHSLHPETPANTQSENNALSGDDAVNIGLFQLANQVRTAVYSSPRYESLEAEVKYPHETQKINVSKEEAERLLELSKELKSSNTRRYSIFKFLGNNCAEDANLFLNQLTRNEQEKDLVQASSQYAFVPTAGDVAQGVNSLLELRKTGKAFSPQPSIFARGVLSFIKAVKYKQDVASPKHSKS